jgi:uncharacterized membrane protein
MFDGTWVAYWTTVKPTSFVVAFAAGLAGAVVINSHQTVFATGVMIALALIPGMAIFGAGLAAGEVAPALQGLLRWSVDAGCVIAACLLVFGLKRALLGRRAQD